MKRIAIAVTTVVVGLVAAGSAFAAINTYTANFGFHGKKGSAHKPAALSFSQTINAKSVTAGNRTGILHDIKVTIYGAKANFGGFPTCTTGKISGAQNDTGCPKKSLVAHGHIKAQLGSAKDFSAAGQACNPLLDVWNGGKGKLVFFFVDKGSHQCLGGQLHTGQVPPWTGKYHQAGKNLVVDIPVPNTVDYPLGVNGGEVGSLSQEFLQWVSQTKGSKHSIASVACKGGKRPWSVKLTASLPGQSNEVKTVTGAGACK